MRAGKLCVVWVILSCWMPLAFGAEAVDPGLYKKNSGRMLKEVGGDAKEDYEAGIIAYDRAEIVESQGLFERAASKGHVKAMVRLGEILERAGFVAEAATWYRKAADLGDADAQFSLGSMYLDISSFNGSKVFAQPDLVQARKWFVLAANQGHEEAISALMHAYVDGGLDLTKEERSDAEILKWIKRGADAGIPSAMNVLAEAYRAGKYGLGADTKQADEMADKAKKAQGIKEEEKKEEKKRKRRL